MTKMFSPKYVVLYADDDQDDLDLVLDAFSRYTDNVELVTARDGFEAFSYLTNLQPFEPSPCLIILDVNMPRMGGKDALKKIRNLDRFSETPVVMFTTSSLPADAQFARQYSAGFITKPLDVSQLTQIAASFIEHCTDDIKKNIRRKLS